MDTLPNGIRAVIKALKETVAPAVDTGNPLANEQLRLACGYLTLVADRMAWREQRLRSELNAAADLAATLLPHAQAGAPAVLAALSEGIASAQDLQQRPGAPESEVVRVTQQLQGGVSALVRTCASLPEPTARAIERVVVKGSGAWLDTRRSWFAPMGFDREAAALPPLSQALRER